MSIFIDQASSEWLDIGHFLYYFDQDEHKNT